MRYRVRALRAGGALATFSLDADSRAAALTQAQESGVTVLSIAPERLGLPRLWDAKRKFPLLLFTQQFLSLLDAGLGAREALEALAAKSPDSEVRVLRAVIADITEGLPLARAFERAGAFPPLFVATLRASERTGNMPAALKRYGEYLAQVEGLRARVTSALIYPALLAATGAAVCAFLVLYVVPRFARIYDDIGRDLPLLSRMLMKGGEAISEHAPLALAAMAVLAVLAFRLASHPRVRERAALAAWRVPRLGEALRLYHLAQFYRSMGMLLDGGMPVTASLRLARELLAASMRPGLDVASRLVNEGLPASVALTRAGLATPVAVSLMQVGERGGRLGAMMDRVAAFHDAQLAQRIDVATRAFEPLLMAMIGVVIGTLVVLLYMPVFDLANSLQ